MQLVGVGVFLPAIATIRRLNAGTPVVAEGIQE